MEINAQKRRSLSICAGVAALAGLVILSFLQLQTKERLHTRGRFHSLGHFCIFALVETLLAMGTRSRRTRLIGAGAMVVLGCAIEIVQKLVYGQPLETLDMQVDALGVAVALLLVLAWDRLRNNSRQSI
jgi:exosortase/archaeosortase